MATRLLPSLSCAPRGGTFHQNGGGDSSSGSWIHTEDWGPLTGSSVTSSTGATPPDKDWRAAAIIAGAYETAVRPPSTACVGARQ